MIAQTISLICSRFFGWRTKRKLLVFESDDWGSLYLPGSAQIRYLEQAGILEKDRTAYRRFDCLERRADLHGLFDVLSEFSDMHGNPAKFTFNTVMGNPDFEKIKQADFQSYHHQPFFESYQLYNDEDCHDIWQSGMNARLVTPQFHAREHLNIRLWLDELRANRMDTRLAFDNCFYSQVRSSKSPKTYMAAYWATSEIHLREIQAILVDGLKMFEGIFGFPSQSFVACKFILPSEIEETLAAKGIHTIQTQRRHRVPVPNTGKSKFKHRIGGMKNRLGQIYSVRNVFFEPFEKPEQNVVAHAMKQTMTAFKCGQPAIVSSHRVNYVSRVEKTNSERSLRQLREYIKRVRAAWPDVEFISSDQLRDIMLGGNDK